METKFVKAFGDPELDREVMDEAGRIIRNGGLVAMPTETVYGLAGDALNPKSARKIYEAKGRPSDNPLIVHIARIEDLDNIAEDIPEEAYKLADRYWPGPLTMVLKKKDVVPKETTGGLDTVAVRFPVNKIAQELIMAAGGYIAAPSANISGRPSCTTAAHCMDDLSGKVDMVIDGGEVGIGLESTIIDLTSDVPCILRQGYINEDMLNEVLEHIGMEGKESEHPKAPGMKYRHYAPRGRLSIVEGDGTNVAGKIKELVNAHLEKGDKVAIIVADENAELYRKLSCKICNVGSREDEDTIAHGLFAMLRALDDEGMEYIYSESFDTPRLGKAIMDRLLRAAGGNIIRTDA